MANSIRLDISASSVEVHGGNYKTLDVSLEGVRVQEILNHITAEDIANHFDHGDLLDEIPLDVVLKHFGIETESK